MTAEERREEWKEVAELVRHAVAGDRRAEERLCVRYRGLIQKTAAEYSSEGLLCSHEDLVQEAYIGFIEGLRKFDYEKGRDFIGWVVNAMRMNIRKCLTEKSRFIQLPKWKVEQISRITKGFRMLEENDIPLTYENISRTEPVMGMKDEHLSENLTIIRNSGMTSLDSTVKRDDEEGRTLAEVTGSGEDFTEGFERADMIARMMRRLSEMDERDRTVIEGKIGLHTERKTEKAIGEEIGLSARSVRTIWQKGICELRRAMAV